MGKGKSTKKENSSDSGIRRPFFLQTWFIVLLCMAWLAIFPPILGIILLIAQNFYEKKHLKELAYTYAGEECDQLRENNEAECEKLRKITQEYRESVESECEKLKTDTKSECDQLSKDNETECERLRKIAQVYKENVESECEKLREEADAYYKNERQSYENRISHLKEECDSLTGELEELHSEVVIEFSDIPFVDETITSEEYKSKYAVLKSKEKDLIKESGAVEILDDTDTPKRVINNNIKQILRCFNSETDTLLCSITSKNIENVKNRIVKSFETLNKIFETDNIRLEHDFLEIKLEEADLLYSCEYQREQERLTQKAIREQMVEEEKVRKEIECEKAKIEKEESHFHAEIDKLMAHLQASSEAEKKLYTDRIQELERKLKEVEESKKSVLTREKNTRAGYVYIISNIGSFGEDIYKIGMTRRLDPLDRIDELSSASVPFNFDVHAMIFSDDASALETKLHNIFANNRVNKINPRKEFFEVSLDEIKKIVGENFDKTVKWVDVAPAEQYRQSLKIASENLVTV